MSENGHRSLERALDIMEFVAGRTKKVKLSEIYNALGIPKGSCFTLVKTLTARKYLNYDPEAAAYSLRVKALEIGDTCLTRGFLYTKNRETSVYPVFTIFGIVPAFAMSCCPLRLLL